jgi:putative transposase
MLRVHKIKLNPNKAQQLYFAQSCGVARHAYNWALAEWKRQYEAGEKPSEASLRKQYNTIKPKEFPWALDVTKCAPQQAIKNVGTAFHNFFRNVKQGKKPGYPKFKKKGQHDSFRADNGPQKKGESAVKVDGKKIQLPRIGWVRMREDVRFTGCIQSTTVSRMADGWYISVLVETEDRLKRKVDKGAVGVDLGIKELAVLSDDSAPVNGPKPHKRLLNRLRRLNKSLSRKKKGGANFKKAKTKLAKLHKRIADIREDSLHKLSHKLATEYSLIGIEDLNVKGMVKNRKLSRAISDQGFGKLRIMMEYKAAMTGAYVVIVDRWFPSSKTCHACGQIHELKLSDRVLNCDCGMIIDRDRNAAINLKNYAVSSTVSACGVPSAGATKVA